MPNYTFVVTEKPDAAARIAFALDIEGKPSRILENGVPYYRAIRDGEIVVVPSLGHLFTVAAKKKGMKYPVFEYQWVPLHFVKRTAKRTRVWLETIAKLARGANSFIDACDFDIEGSLVGYTLLKFACGGAEKAAKRMKYSTLTKSEIIHSYSEILPHLDFHLIEAGLARHEVDWLYGINLSRALTTATKKTSGRYAVFSTGRVQGPTLRYLVARERSIKDFSAKPFWNVNAKARIGESLVEVAYEKVLDNQEEANHIAGNCTGKNGTVGKIEIRKFRRPPPPPFDSNSLQIEAFRLYKYTPMRTSQIAQRLYLDTLISYPRTSSQKLPATIGYADIIKKLSRVHEFKKCANELLAKTELKPREGKGFDPAHPAIYPTGELPERALRIAEKNVWYLIIRRFLAAFSQPSLQRSTSICIDVGGMKFGCHGVETLSDGWLSFYKAYSRVESSNFPPISEDQTVTIEEASVEKESTKPPVRYNPASLLRKMQKEEIGTKATRAGIVQTLYDRKYIQGEKIVVTDTGIEVVDVLRKYCPEIVSSELTRNLEEKMWKIQEGSETKESVIKETIEILKPVLQQLRSQEAEIGIRLSQAVEKSKLLKKAVGNCPTCQEGKLLVVRSKKTGKRFIGCTGYFEGKCKTSFPLPQQGIIKPKGSCSKCGWPTVKVTMRRKRPWTLCLNPNCPSKRKLENA